MRRAIVGRMLERRLSKFARLMKAADARVRWGGDWPEFKDWPHFEV